MCRCPLQDNDGECVPMDKYCPAVKPAVCKALISAYDMGYRSCTRSMYEMFLDSKDASTDKGSCPVVYFEFNDWTPGVYYPDTTPFTMWLEDDSESFFRNEEWVNEQQLCVLVRVVDMSINYCITAPKRWVLENCPELLTKYTKFLRHPNEENRVFGRFGNEFLTYSADNIGITYAP